MMVQTEMSYPIGAGYKKVGTSQEAAAAINPKVNGMRLEIFNLIDQQGPMTPDQCARELGLSILSVRPRCAELLRMAVLRDTGERRPNLSGKSAAVLGVNYDGGAI